MAGPVNPTIVSPRLACCFLPIALSQRRIDHDVQSRHLGRLRVSQWSRRALCFDRANSCGLDRVDWLRGHFSTDMATRLAAFHQEKFAVAISGHDWVGPGLYGRVDCFGNIRDSRGMSILSGLGRNYSGDVYSGVELSSPGK